MSSLELTAPPTKEEVLQLRRQAYCNAYMHWMQTHGYNPDNWGFLDGPIGHDLRREHQRAAIYSREMADLVVAALLQEYP